jgi:uncharacterized protein (TIGR02147 family)
MNDETELAIEPTTTDGSPSTPNAVSPTPPHVFDFSNYREFLKAALNFRKMKNPNYSETALLKAAGFGSNSRGYFNLIISGRRNLSPKSILGFAQALKMSDKGTLYFENLVHYNQSETLRDKALYFARISQLIKGKETREYELMKSQYNYYSHWYYVAIRELAAFVEFKEDTEWISKKLRDEVTAKEIRSAIQDLVKLGLLQRDDKGLLRQSTELVTFTDNSLNYTVVNEFHTQMLEKAKNVLSQDAYQDRSVSCVTMACDVSKFEEMRGEIRAFRERMLEKYGSKPETVDGVLNLGIQLFHITPVEKKEKKV